MAQPPALVPVGGSARAVKFGLNGLMNASWNWLAYDRLDLPERAEVRLADQPHRRVPRLPQHREQDPDQQRDDRDDDEQLDEREAGGAPAGGRCERHVRPRISERTGF
jgi:hypothetical protein